MDPHFLSELNQDAIHIHDDLQFELKLEFDRDPHIKKNIFVQEFYLFIPESLQINPETYSKKDFYLDQTNFIRYKTPDLTFNELLNPAFIKSPFYIIPLMKVNNENDLREIINAIKLLGNIFRSTLRNNMIEIFRSFRSDIKPEELNPMILQCLENIKKTHSLFLEIETNLEQKFQNEKLNQNVKFVDEFITNTIDYYLMGLLEKIRLLQIPELKICDQNICELLISEDKHRKQLLPKEHRNSMLELTEMISYRHSLLNKFMLEALQLKSNRIAVSEQHRPLLGALAAGIAMLIYMVLFLFTWKSSVFVINSIPFVLSVVLFYILKDRIKDEVKSYYKQKAGKWFPDYQTKIYSLQDVPIGELTENFYFLEKSQLPPEICKVRNEGFHNHLETLHRHETIICYKREVHLFKNLVLLPFMNKLNMIFRYNIHRYLEKASDPIQYKAILENEHDLIFQQFSKLYHLNIVIKETNPSGRQVLKKFRVLLNKKGLEEVEIL